MPEATIITTSSSMVAQTTARCRRLHFTVRHASVGRVARIGLSSKKRRRSSASSWAVA